MPRLQNSFMTAFNNDESTPSFGERWLSNFYLSILDQSTLAAKYKEFDSNEIPTSEELAQMFSDEKWGWKWSYKWLTVPATAIVEVLTNTLAEITLSANIGLDTWKRNSLQTLDQKSWSALGVKVAHGFAKTFAVGFHGITSSISFIGHYFNRMTNSFSKNPATTTFTTLTGTTASIIVGGTVGLTALLSNPVGWAIILIGGPIALAALASKVYTDYQEIKNDRKLIQLENIEKTKEKEEKKKASDEIITQRVTTSLAAKIETDYQRIVPRLVPLVQQYYLDTIIKHPNIDFSTGKLITSISSSDAAEFGENVYKTAYLSLYLHEDDTKDCRKDEKIKPILDPALASAKFLDAQSNLFEQYREVLHAMRKTKAKANDNLSIEEHFFSECKTKGLSDPTALTLWDKYSADIISKYNNRSIKIPSIASDFFSASFIAIAVNAKPNKEHKAAQYAILNIKTTNNSAMATAYYLGKMLDDHNENPATFNMNTHKADFLRPEGVGSIPEAQNDPQLQEMIWNRIVAEFDKAIDVKLKKSQDALNTYKRPTADDDSDSEDSIASSHSSETLAKAVDTSVAEIKAAEEAAKAAAKKVANIIDQALPAKATEETQSTNHSVLASWNGSTATPLRNTQQFLRPTVKC